jgi:hypothetical protein
VSRRGVLPGRRPRYRRCSLTICDRARQHAFDGLGDAVLSHRARPVRNQPGLNGGDGPAGKRPPRPGLRLVSLNIARTSSAARLSEKSMDDLSRSIRPALVRASGQAAFNENGQTRHPARRISSVSVWRPVARRRRDRRRRREPAAPSFGPARRADRSADGRR